jgi:hypothetical protein
MDENENFCSQLEMLSIARERSKESSHVWILGSLTLQLIYAQQPGSFYFFESESVIGVASS